MTVGTVRKTAGAADMAVRIVTGRQENVMGDLIVTVPAVQGRAAGPTGCVTDGGVMDRGQAAVATVAVLLMT